MEQSSLYKKQFYMTEEITLVLQKRMGKRFKEKSISMWQVHGIFHCNILVILDVYVIGNSVIKITLRARMLMIHCPTMSCSKF